MTKGTNGFETDLRSQLADAAALVDAEPLRPRSTRRVRVRQLAASLGAVAVLAAAAVGAATALDAFRDPAPAPAAGPEQLDPHGSGGTYPCERPDLEGACIAAGTFEGQEWAIGATFESNELCMTNWFGRSMGSVTGSGCGRYDPDDLGMDTSSPGSGLELMSGEVPPDVDMLVLERSGGERIELELYPAPAELRVEMNFYAVFVPTDATAIAGFDVDGKETLRKMIDDRMRGDIGSDGAVEEAVVLEGELRGVRWELRAHQTGPGSPCVGLSYIDGALGGALGSCPRRKDDRPFGYQLGPFARRTDVIVIYGWITAPVDHLMVKTRAGREQGYIVEAPEGIDDDYRFFVAFPPAPPKGPVKAVFIGFDAAGKVIEETSLCPGYKLASHSTCGS